MAGVRLALFDFDGTLCRGDSIVPYLFYAIRRGKAPKRQLLRAAWGYFRGHALKRDDRRAKEDTLSFIRGKTVGEMDALARDFFQKRLMRRMYLMGIEEMKRLKSDGVMIVVLSASPGVYMRVLPEYLPADAVLSTRCAQNGCNVYLGQVAENCKGEEKVKRLAAWRKANGLEDAEIVAAYGDSASDGPMLRLAERAVLVNAGRKARMAAPGASEVRWK